MNGQQLQEIADKVIAALESLAPGDPQWWVPVAAFGSYAALMAVVIVFAIAQRSQIHRQEAPKVQMPASNSMLKLNREVAATSEWWRRTEWALEATAARDVVMNDYGLKMLGVLAKSGVADSEEKAMLDAVWQGSFTRMQDGEIDQLLEDAHESEDQVLATLRREILAARLKVILDEELGRETSPKVKQLAAMDLPRIVRPYRRAGDIQADPAGTATSPEQE